MSQNIIILVVDDEPYITESVKEELSIRNNQLKIITKNKGYEALQEIMEGNVDLVITDIAMPDMDGYELYSRARELHENLPIIMMTGFGYDPNHVVVKAKKDGLHDVFFKPLDYDRLMNKIKERLALD